MRTERQAYLDKQIIRVLAASGSNPLPETALRDHLDLRIAPPPRAQEIDQSLAYLESGRRIIATEGESCLLWRLTETGRSWWAENQF